MKHIFTLAMILSVFTVYGQSKKTKKLFDKAYEYSMNGENTKAIETYLKVIEMEPGYSSPYLNIGTDYKEIGEYDLAIKYLNTAIQIDPEGFKAYAELGTVYSRLKQYEKADKYFKQALSKHSGTGLDTLYLKMGNNFIDWNLFDSAMFYFDKSLEIHSNFMEALTNIAYLHIIQENYLEARKHLETLVQEYPDFTNNFNNLGYVLCKLNDLDNAEKYLQQSLKMDSKNEWTYRNFGILYQAKGDQKNACKNLDKAIELGFIRIWGRELIQELMDYCK
ncbi:tetratricopeptide repeat protein [bacterium SCSIO 12643]|nr:tetratricopeptide repeat protein [bacterium SCSIO 12643]